MRRTILSVLALGVLVVAAARGVCPDPAHIYISVPATNYAVGAEVPVTGWFMPSLYDTTCDGSDYEMTFQCVNKSFSFGPPTAAHPDSQYVDTHVFDEAGTYTLRVQVTAFGGPELFSDTLTITVGTQLRDLQPGDFEYLGCFRTGGGAGDTLHGAPGGLADRFELGAPSEMAYTASGDTTSDGYPGLLWMMGVTMTGQPFSGKDHEGGVMAINCGGKVAAMKIPVPVLTANLDSMPVAAVARPMFHIAWNEFNMKAEDQIRLTGMWVDDKDAAGVVTSAHTIWWNQWDYYNGETGPDDGATLGYWDLTDSTEHGMYHIGDYVNGSNRSPNFANKYVKSTMQIPTPWLEQFVGTGYRVGGSNGGREGGYSNGWTEQCNPIPPSWPVADESRTFCGNGPSLGVYQLPEADADSGSTVNLKTLLCYNNGQRHASYLPPAETAPGDTLGDNDEWRSGIWIETEWARGLIYICHKCLYNSHYHVSECDSDGGTCGGGGKGFKCGRAGIDPAPAFDNRLYCYRIADIEAVANNNLPYSAPQPVWRMSFDDFFIPYADCGGDFTCDPAIGGMAWDSVNHLLYVAQPNADTKIVGCYEPAAVIHVFRVADAP